MTNTDIYPMDVHPDAVLIRKLMDYDPETGKLFWKSREGENRFNACRAGKEAGNLSKNGYIQIQNKHFPTLLAHRLVWLHYYGQWPKQFIDHIDRNRANNAINNLRDCSKSENNRNRDYSSLSGVRGVIWRSHTQKWVAQGTVDGKKKSFGSFDTVEEAKLAYDAGMKDVPFTKFIQKQNYNEFATKITHKELLALLSYDPATGRWYRKGKLIRPANKKAYHKFMVNGRQYYSHILAWFYMTGSWPTKKIDHIDCDISNNSFDNLRETCNSKNGFNRVSRPDRGVTYIKRSGLWRSQIKVNGKLTMLGNFQEKDQAILAFQNAYYDLMGERPKYA